MILHLSHAHLQALVDHARRAAPTEACGVIIGRADFNNVLRAVEIMPLENRAAEPHHTYYIDGHALESASIHAARKGLSLIALYHAHPNGDVLPSPSDRAHANYPELAQVIIGLRGGEAQIAAWRIDVDAVDRVEIITDESDRANDYAKINSTQRTALLISAALAFLIVIAVSLALLPPAPPLPR